MPKDQIMTVAVIVLPGKNAASKIHSQVVKIICAHYKIKDKGKLQQWYDEQRLHFADMSHFERLLTGETLAKADLKAYIANTQHTIHCRMHSYRFALYKELVMTTIKAALTDFDDLIINIGRQGGSRPEHFTKSGLYKKARFSLLSAGNTGIQLADFYVGASRNYLLSKFTSVSAAPFLKVAHQIVELPELEHK